MMPFGERYVILAVVLVLMSWQPVAAYAHEGELGLKEMHGHHGSHQDGSSRQWEGSVEGRAYSEFNHHLAGIFVILIALGEWRATSFMRLAAASRLLLPVSMGAAGLFLLVWSDHEGWPIGTMPFTQTFVTGEWETVQHKWFGICLLAIGTVEWFRRAGRLTHAWAKFPLPALAILGGLSLFLHSHGVHPAAHTIGIHHAAMGAMAITAGSSKILANGDTGSRWDKAWALIVLLIGLQLLLYSES